MRMLIGLAAVSLLVASESRAAPDVDRLVGAMLADTAIISDLQSLTDEMGGRVTGSAANEAAIDWALARFERAAVEARRESFEMPFQWREKSTEAEISGDHSFTAGVIAKPFSKGADLLKAPLVDAGMGSAEDFKRLGDEEADAW